ncbi:hypothetical protein P154DRAFT_586372 [Amniculicola lignicola CBS 123094]|uniref:DUF7587 domain-containing protein n=1 Tax=Amniculicola lignicola CBS 123094 TaxID=1392246 RepID=A0A6A5WSB3_9PLEO|nr:hypothetical protein P154DRAFT_586372 [Amniculicola lignicola CBS 123094]
MSDSGKFFYRCYSESSVGGLISGKGRGHGRLFSTALRSEFWNHVQLDNKKPTALVSTSNRLIDTIQRAFNKFYRNREHPGQIWIAFIYVPDVDQHVYHHAEYLAKKYGCQNSGRLRYEYLFEWQIPENCLLHKVSVKTLIEREFNMEEYLDQNGVLPPTWELREEFAQRNLCPSDGGHDIGLSLGLLARRFGARAPVRRIALQLLLDCADVKSIDYNTQMVKIAYSGNRFIMDFSHFRDIDDGIDTALFEWWLEESQFMDAYEEHCDWALQI